MQKNWSAIIPNRMMKKMIGVVVPGFPLLFFLSISTAIGDSLDVGGAVGTHDILVPGDHDGEAGADPDAHFTFMTGGPSSGAVTTVNYFIDNHGGADNLSAGQILNLQAAAGIWNAAGANVFLAQVFSDAAADIHVHGSSVSACGGGVIGCAAFAYFIAHSGAYGDAHDHHQMASNLNTPGLQILTMITRSDWYTGTAGGIGGSELDYLSVAIQEFGHHLGLGHNSVASGHGDSGSSPMNGILPGGTERRTLQPSDVTAIQHLYGAAVGVPEPSTLLLLTTGFGAMAFFRRRKK